MEVVGFKTVWFCEPTETTYRINYEIWYRDVLHLSTYLETAKEMPPELLQEACEYLEDYAMEELEAVNHLPI